jgi:hypothetical protein
MPDFYATSEQIARLKQADKSFKRKSYKQTKGCPGNEPHYLCSGNVAIATRTLGHKPRRKGVGLCYSEPATKGKKRKPAPADPPGMALGMARSEAQRQVAQRAKQAAGIRPGSKEQRSRVLDNAFEAARTKRGRKSIAKKVLGPRSKLFVAMKAGKMMRGGS